MKRVPSCMVLALLLASAASAALTPEQTREAQKLLRDFNAAEFDARQQAVDKLVAMGPDVIPLVWKTLAETKDAEVKMRCEMVMKGIGERFGVTPEGLETDRKLGLPTSRVTLEEKDRPVRGVLESLAEQSGNRSPMARDAAVLDRPVTLSVKDAPYWEALDALCRAAGLSYQFYIDRVELRDRRDGEEDIGAYAGPFVVKLYECRRSNLSVVTRTVRPFGGETPLKTAGEAKFWLGFSYAFERRLPVGLDGLRLLSVKDSDGAELLVQDGQDGRTPVFRRFQSRGRADVECPDPAPGRKLLVTVSGLAEMSVSLGHKQLRVGDLFAKEHQPVASDGYTFLVTSASHRNRGVNIALDVEREISGHFRHHRGGREVGFALVSPSGKRYDRLRSCEILGSGMGTWNYSGDDVEVYLPAWVSPRPGQSEAFKMKLGFSDVEPEDGAWAFVYEYPEKTETRSYPFTIKDIPLP